MGDRKRRAQNREDWSPWLQKLNEVRQRSREMGGPEKVERLMHQRGKLDVGEGLILSPRYMVPVPTTLLSI